MAMIYKVIVSEKAQNQLSKAPPRIAGKLYYWARTVGEIGLENVRRIPGFHDEPLQGKRKGQRSIRLSLHYRAIYEVKKEDILEFIWIEEVTKHEY